MSYREYAENYDEGLEVEVGGAPGDGFGDTLYGYMGNSTYDPTSNGRTMAPLEYWDVAIGYRQQWWDT